MLFCQINQSRTPLLAPSYASRKRKSPETGIIPPSVLGNHDVENRCGKYESSIENTDNQKRLSPEQKRFSKDKDKDEDALGEGDHLNSFAQSQSEMHPVDSSYFFLATSYVLRLYFVQ